MLLTNLIDHTKEHYGEYPAIYFEERAYSNLEVENLARKISIILRKKGIADGERVIVSMPNNAEVIISYQGILRARNIVIPVMYILHPNEINFILKDSEAKAVITTASVLPNMIEATKNLAQHVTFIVVDHIEDKSVLVAHDVIELNSEIENVDVSEEILSPAEENDVAVILYTSGTTGRPKGVMLTHKNLSVGPMHEYKTRGKAGTTERDATIVVLPLAHIYGFGVMITSMLLGESIVIFSRFEMDKVCEAIEKFQVQSFAVVPAMLHGLAFSPVPDQYNLSSLAYVNCGSASLPQAVIDTFEKRFNAEIREAYGLSEASTAGVSGHRDGVRIKRGTVGTPYPYVQVKLVDHAGNEVPVGEVGEVLVKGESISEGYYRLPEETEKTIRNGWLHTGDMAKMDEEGYIQIVDRKKDLIIRGGFNIYPRDLEEMIMRHPAVSDVAVIGIPDERMGEQIVACVVKKQEHVLTEEEIIAYTQENLAKYKTPKRVIFVENLPRNGVGKILKMRLREEFKDVDLGVK